MAARRVPVARRALASRASRRAAGHILAHWPQIAIERCCIALQRAVSMPLTVLLRLAIPSDRTSVAGDNLSQVPDVCESRSWLDDERGRRLIR